MVDCDTLGTRRIGLHRMLSASAQVAFEFTEYRLTGLNMLIDPSMRMISGVVLKMLVNGLLGE